MKSFFLRSTAVALVCLLQACASSGTRAPIEARGAPPAPAKVVSPPPSGGAEAARALPDRPVPRAEPLLDEEPSGDHQLALATPLDAPAPGPTPRPRDAATASLLAAAMQAATQDDWERALAALERAVKLAPDDAGLWHQLAYAHLRRGDNEQALQTARRALSLPASPAERARTWMLLADIETARGDPAAAAAARAQATP